MKKILFAILFLSVLSAAAIAEEKLLVGEDTSVGITDGGYLFGATRAGVSHPHTNNKKYQWCVPWATKKNTRLVSEPRTRWTSSVIWPPM